MYVTHNGSVKHVLFLCSAGAFIASHCCNTLL